MNRTWRTLAVVAALALVAACDPQTATAPTGDLELIATFDDVQDLTRGDVGDLHVVAAGEILDVVEGGDELEVAGGRGGRLRVAGGQQTEGHDGREGSPGAGHRPVSSPRFSSRLS